MPKEFRTIVGFSFDNKENIKIDRFFTCRESWLSEVNQAWKSDYKEAFISTPVDLRVKVVLQCENLKNLSPFLDEIIGMYNGEIKFSFSEEYNEYTDDKVTYLHIESKGFLSIGAAWWLILILRLFYSAKRETSILELIRHSVTKMENWYNSGDKNRHIELLPKFKSVRFFEFWALSGADGPINYLSGEYRLIYPAKPSQRWCEICNDYHDEDTSVDYYPFTIVGED